MKKQLLFLGLGFAFSCSGVFAQTYVNDMTKAEIERDCFIDGSANYVDKGDNYYDNDDSYIQKKTADAATALTFPMDLVGNKYMTGFRVNMLLRKDDKAELWAKVEYSKDEVTYIAVPEMKVEFSYDEILGNGYWADVYFQGALPSGTKELKVTLLARPGDANWIPMYRRTEIFYEGGTPYAYMTPPHLVVPEEYPEDFLVDFESDNFIATMGGSQNDASSIEVVDNPKKDGTNSSEKVLKFVQAIGGEWGWGNGDWFGASIAMKTADDKEQTVQIGSKKYLHFSVYHPTSTKIAMETWNGSAGLKDQLDFTPSEGWVDVVIDMTERVDKTFKSFYYSPNVLYQTNEVTEAQVSYIDNIYLSDSPTSSITSDIVEGLNIVSGKGAISVLNAENETVEIYDLSGKLITKVQVTSQSENISLSAGIYIVKTANRQAKALVF